MIKRFLFLFLLFSVPLVGADDWQYWSWFQKSFYQKDNLELSLFAEARIGDTMKNPKLYLLSPRLSVEIHPNLDLGFHFTYIRFKSTGYGFRNQHRFELQATPHFARDKWKFAVRNRLEAIRTQGSIKMNSRFRQRLQVTRTLSSVGRLEGIYFGNEWFYDFGRGKTRQDRLTPLGATFRIGDKTRLSVFSLIQFFDSGGGNWKHNAVFGTYFYLN